MACEFDDGKLRAQANNITTGKIFQEVATACTFDYMRGYRSSRDIILGDKCYVEIAFAGVEVEVDFTTIVKDKDLPMTVIPGITLQENCQST